MHVALSGDRTCHVFAIWVYGERDLLVRGSGLFVGETGIAANHHFLPSRDTTSFAVTEGCYRLDVFAHLLGDAAARRLFTQELEISPEVADALEKPGARAYFDWLPDAKRYSVHTDTWEAPAYTSSSTAADDPPTPG
jgi:hypothetical protein